MKEAWENFARREQERKEHEKVLQWVKDRKAAQDAAKRNKNS